VLKNGRFKQKMVVKYLVCKNCKRLIENEKNLKSCPICKNNNLIEKYKGRIVIIDAHKSKIANTLDIIENGNYALKL
jgi:RNA polymerase subunit RPABC4/transcription elongation factor Spt4